MSLPSDVRSVILSYGCFDRELIERFPKEEIVIASRMMIGSEKKISHKDALYILSTPQKEWYDFKKVIKEGNLPLLHFALSKILKESGEPLSSWSHIEYAAEYGNIEIAQYLLDIGVDIHLENERALHEACYAGQIEMVKFLLSRGADIHCNEDAILLAAIWTENCEMIQLLIDWGVNIHCQRDFPIKKASAMNSTEMLEILIKAGGNIHIFDDYLLMNTTNIEIAKYLLQNGGDIHAYEVYCFQKAISRKDLNYIRFLVEMGANIREQGNLYLELASAYGHEEIVKYLLEHL